ncbi:unnamed protein product, partial [Ectocarpus sp. 12 AP-2014]
RCNIEQEGKKKRQVEKKGAAKGVVCAGSSTALSGRARVAAHPNADDLLGVGATVVRTAGLKDELRVPVQVHHHRRYRCRQVMFAA